MTCSPTLPRVVIWAVRLSIGLGYRTRIWTRLIVRACFTVFPSLCEGWGLPIAESLAHGKFFVASNRTSIPEVGGDLIDYFDPSDDDDALAKIERLLFEPGYLAAREA
jgi:glycosyltransferase involved in cell wall biosynthesis